MVPFFSARDVAAAVPPHSAYEAVRRAFEAHARHEWTMQPKLYVANYPAGDFRAMPALGGGHALLKWVTSFPGNLALGLPTVTGLVVLSNADTGLVEAILDAGAVTALRTGAAAVLAADVLGRQDAETAAVIGAGVNGRAAARTFASLGRSVSLWDVDQARAEAVAAELGVEVAESRDEALGADLLVTVTPGREILLGPGSLLPGQHVSLMGADGPGKAEIAIEEIARARVFCDEWEQASHGGELAAADRGRRDRTRGCHGARRRPDRDCGWAHVASGDHDFRFDRARDPGSRDREGRSRSSRRAGARADRSLGENARGIEELELGRALAEDRGRDELTAYEPEHVAMSGVASRDPESLAPGYRARERTSVRARPEDSGPPMRDLGQRADELDEQRFEPFLDHLRQGLFARVLGFVGAAPPTGDEAPVGRLLPVVEAAPRVVRSPETGAPRAAL